MEAWDIARVLVGLVLLVGGGEVLVRGASALALRFGISPLVVGLTVVSAATSAPELAVSVGASLQGQPDLAVGNVVGSNIVNILLILGASALVLPLTARAQLVRLDIPVMVLMSALLLVLAGGGGVTTAEGALLLGLVVAYLALTLAVSRRAGRKGGGTPEVGVEDPGQGGGSAARVVLSLLLVVAGVALLVAGAELLVGGATAIAGAFGVSGLVIGLTVVAVGTSLPELATSIIAALRGQRDLALGNVVGSNILNIGLVLGIPAIISPGGLPVPPAAVAFDIPLMLAAAVALLPVVITGFRVNRWEGLMFLVLYAAFTAYLVLDAIGHDALDGFTLAMVFFVLPLVVITLVATLGYELGLRAGRRQAGPTHEHH